MPDIISESIIGLVTFSREYESITDRTQCGNRHMTGYTGKCRFLRPKEGRTIGSSVTLRSHLPKFKLPDTLAPISNEDHPQDAIVI